MCAVEYLPRAAELSTNVVTCWSMLQEPGTSLRAAVHGHRIKAQVQSSFCCLQKSVQSVLSLLGHTVCSSASLQVVDPVLRKFCGKI